MLQTPSKYKPVSDDDDDEPNIASSSNHHHHSMRPVHYQDSSDEESEVLLEKNGRNSPGYAERGHVLDEPETGLVVGGGKKRPSTLRWLVLSLAALVCLAAVIGFFAARTYTGGPVRVSGGKKITMDHLSNGTFSADSRRLNWVPEAGDGVFSIYQNAAIKLVDLKTNTTTTLVAMKDVKDENGEYIYWTDWKLSADMKYMLLKADHRKQWRWSSFGNYYIHELETHTTYPLIPPTYPAITAYATWSPTGQSIAYVTNNDLYILPSPSASSSAIRVTTSGNASLFHGVPDWVYEEEVFSSDFALWWSPDSSKVAFLRLDETLVDEYRFPIFNPTEDSSAIIPYTKEVVMKYPKPGYDNPLASIHIFDLAKYLKEDGAGVDEFPIADSTFELGWDDRHSVENSIIQEVIWVGNDTLILKEVNRAADNGNVVLFQLSDTSSADATNGYVVRKLGKNGEEGDDGWIESAHRIYPLPNSLTGGSPAYLDIVPDADGYNHIALFNPADSRTPRFLTSGAWEVTAGILAVDVERALVYFQAASPSVERHIYAVAFPVDTSSAQTEPTLLTDASSPSLHSASFSPEAGFYLLSYQGPGIPWQKVVQVENTNFDYVLTDNTLLNETLSQFEAAVVTYTTIVSDGYELNVKEIRPPRMDDSGRTKYPVMFFLYGGPGSQKVDMNYNRDWQDYLACAHQYITVIVDGRGTGYKGRKLRNPVRNNLGYWEAQDQINAARMWAGKDYVDRKRIGIWGWSYGGFMSSKVIEADAGIHSLAIAVAPVTSWRLYDSIYTERYMDLPEKNAGGYINASISRVEGFRNVDYLLAHGSGDDNVHYANSAHLLDMLTQAQIRNFRFRMFTDSDHTINRRGANRELYEYMTLFLLEKWGKGGRRRGW